MQSQSGSTNNSLYNWLLLLFLGIIWGSSFYLIKKGLVIFSPTQVASMRIFFAMLVLLPFVPMSFKKIERKQLPFIMLLGVLGSGIPPFLFTAAQMKLDSATTSILNSLTPLFAFLFGVFFFGVLFSWRKLMGVLMGLLGALSIIWATMPSDGGENNYLYGFYVVLASILYATNINLLKTYGQNISPLALNVLAFLFIGPIAGIHLFSTDFLSLFSMSGAWFAFIHVLILAVVGTAFATILFFRLAQQTDALFAAMVTYIIPIVGLLLGALDGEAITWAYLGSMVLILSGVYLARKN